MIEGMLEVTRNKEFYDIIKKVPLQNLLMRICQFLCRVIKISCFMSAFAQYKFEILFDICFSFIRTFENEKKEMLDNPSEFVRESLDAVDRQKIPNLKCQAAKLLEVVTEKVEGLMIIAGHITLELINHCVLEETDVNKFQYLNQYYPNFHFLQHATDEEKIDVALVFITQMSYMIPKNPQLCGELKKTF